MTTKIRMAHRMTIAEVKQRAGQMLTQSCAHGPLTTIHVTRVVWVPRPRSLCLGEDQDPVVIRIVTEAGM